MPSARGWRSAKVVVPLLVLAVFASRIPAISLDTELNPDESQMLAQVMRLGIDPVPWRGMDGTTSGPLNTWALALPHALGMPLDYRWLHALAACVLAAICGLGYASLRLLAGPGTAAVGASVAALAIALAQGANFTHFGSELVPALIESAVLLGLAGRLARPRHARPLDLGTALLVGVLPWTKLQSVLGAGALGAWILWNARPLRGEAGSRPVPPAHALAVAALLALPTIVILAVTVAGGAWPDFWASYVLGNLAYVGAPGLGSLAARVVAMLASPPSRLMIGTLGLELLWWRLGRPGWSIASAPQRTFTSVVASLAAANALAVLTPRSAHQHFGTLLIAPLSLLAACILEMWRTAPARRRPAGVAFALFMLALPLTAGAQALRDARATVALRAGVADTPARRVAAVVRSVAPRARRLAVWGWMPALYVETGIAPAVRHAVCHFVIDPSPARSRLRATYLADVRAERPDVIVDAIADGCFRRGWGPAERIPSFPELDRYVRENYVLAAEPSLARTPDPVRVYVRRGP